MKKTKLLSLVISLVLALSILTAVGAFTAFAVGEDGQPAQEDYQPEVPADPPADTPAAEETPQTPAEQPADTPQEPAPENEPLYEYIYDYSEDMTSAYEEPQYLNELPEVSRSDVQEATAVVIPEVAVSDATMFSGIVMWLCVALGIAVIVGVMVSKRTLRRGA